MSQIDSSMVIKSFTSYREAKKYIENSIDAIDAVFIDYKMWRNQKLKNYIKMYLLVSEYENLNKIKIPNENTHVLKKYEKISEIYNSITVVNSSLEDKYKAENTKIITIYNMNLLLNFDIRKFRKIYKTQNVLYINLNTLVKDEARYNNTSNIVDVLYSLDTSDSKEILKNAIINIDNKIDVILPARNSFEFLDIDTTKYSILIKELISLNYDVIIFEIESKIDSLSYYLFKNSHEVVINDYKNEEERYKKLIDISKSKNIDVSKFVHKVMP